MVPAVLQLHVFKVWPTVHTKAVFPALKNKANFQNSSQSGEI